MPFKPSIKIISVPKPSDQVTHNVIVHVLPKLNSNQKVLVEVSNKVYLAQNNVADVKIIKPFNNEAIINNSSLPDIQVKVFVYDSLNDKITNAYSQLFQYSTILATLNSTDIIKSTVPTIVSDWSKFRVKKKQDTAKNKLKTKKTKVHFTIGVFFDGTANNRFNSETVYYDKLNRDNIVYSKIPQKKTLKNGEVIENDDSYWNPYSNIVLLHDLYEEKKITTKNYVGNRTFKVYAQGIGTMNDLDDDVAGSGFGEGKNGIIGKVNEACILIAEEISLSLDNDSEIGSLTFDVFGFSRGAAAARHFCNEILGQSSIKKVVEKGKTFKDDKNKIIGQLKDKNIGKEYLLGLLGEHLKNKKVQSKIRELNTENKKVNIRFVGLFDTVVGQFIIKDHFGKKVDLLLASNPHTRIATGIGTFIESKLDIVKQKIDNLPIQKIVHFTAKDEWRDNFALTKAGNNDNIFEVSLPGSHSDIGGGYAANKEDIDILDYDFSSYEGYTLKNEIPKRLLILKDFYINNGYCAKEKGEIEIIRINYTKNPSTAGYSFVENFQLLAKRKITPRYSIVNMYAMRELAKLSNVPFNLNIENTKYQFEYKTPKELIKYQEELIDKLKLEINGKKSKAQKYSVKKNVFIHLSANYNISKLIEKKGESIIGIKSLDKLLYINHPNYGNNEKTNYNREIYTHHQ